MFNTGGTSRAVTIRFEDPPSGTCRELLHDQPLPLSGGSVSLELGPEQVAVLAVEP